MPGLSRSYSVPGEVSFASIASATNGSLSACHVPHSGSAEGWQWFDAKASASPKKCTWSSGFPRTADAHDPDKLQPLELFRWSAEVLRMSESDIDSIRVCKELPHEEMANTIYNRLLEFKALREHLHVNDKEKFKQRKTMMCRYLQWLLNLEPASTESYVHHLDYVGAVHQRKACVPRTQLLLGLAVTQDTIMRHMCAHISDKAELRNALSAVGKLMWIQAIFFLKHAPKARRFRGGPFLRCTLMLFCILACHRRAGTTFAIAKLRAYLIDAMVAAASSALILIFADARRS